MGDTDRRTALPTLRLAVPWQWRALILRVKFYWRYVRPLRRKMAELGLTMDQVGKYLWARGAVDRNALVRSRNGQFPTGGSGLLDSEAIAIIKNFIREGFEPDLAKIGKMHDQLVDDMLLLQAEEDMLPFDDMQAEEDILSLGEMADLGLSTDEVIEYLLGEYLWARGAVDRNALVRSRNGQFPTGGSGLMDSEALAILNNFLLDGLLPDLAKIGKMHDQLVDDMLLLQAEEDMLPFDEVAKLRKSQPFYTPLKRLAVFGDFQNAGWGPEHKRRSQFNRKSIEQKISVCNPLDNLLLDLKRLLEAVARKRAGLGSVDKGDSQAGEYLIQGGFWGGYLDPGTDERRGMGLS